MYGEKRKTLVFKLENPVERAFMEWTQKSVVDFSNYGKSVLLADFKRRIAEQANRPVEKG